MQEERTKASAQAKLEELSRLAKRKVSELEAEDTESGPAIGLISLPDGNDRALEPSKKKTKKSIKSKKTKVKNIIEEAAA